MNVQYGRPVAASEGVSRGGLWFQLSLGFVALAACVWVALLPSEPAGPTPLLQQVTADAQVLAALGELDVEPLEGKRPDGTPVVTDDDLLQELELLSELEIGQSS